MGFLDIKGKINHVKDHNNDYKRPLYGQLEKNMM